MHRFTEHPRLQWVPASNGDIPPDAVNGGVNDKGETLYIARISINHELVGWPRHLLPAYVVPPSKKAITYFAIKDEIIANIFTSSTYEVLTCKNPDLLYWQSLDSVVNYEFQSSVLYNLLSPRYSYRSAALFYGKIESFSMGKIFAKLSKTAVTALPAIGIIKPNNDFMFDFSNPQCKSCCYTSVKNKLVEAESFLVLCVHQLPPLSHFCFPNIKWVDVSGDHIPLDAFPISKTVSGNLIYLAKAERKCRRQILLAGVAVSLGKLQYLHLPESYNQDDIKFSILAIVDPASFQWSFYFCEEIRKISPPLNAVPICCNWSHRLSCIARKVLTSDKLLENASTNSSMQSGVVSKTQFVGITVSSSGMVSYFPVLDRESTFDYSSFDILVAKTSPRTLKQLCRNVIITTTLAIPDRVDKLSLPDFLKGYCKLMSEEKLCIPVYM